MTVEDETLESPRRRMQLWDRLRARIAAVLRLLADRVQPGAEPRVEPPPAPADAASDPNDPAAGPPADWLARVERGPPPDWARRVAQGAPHLLRPAAPGVQPPTRVARDAERPPASAPSPPFTDPAREHGEGGSGVSSVSGAREREESRAAGQEEVADPSRETAAGRRQPMRIRRLDPPPTVPPAHGGPEDDPDRIGRSADAATAAGTAPRLQGDRTERLGGSAGRAAGERRETGNVETAAPAIDEAAAGSPSADASRTADRVVESRGVSDRIGSAGASSALAASAQPTDSAPAARRPERADSQGTPWIEPPPAGPLGPLGVPAERYAASAQPRDVFAPPRARGRPDASIERAARAIDEPGAGSPRRMSLPPFDSAPGLRPIDSRRDEGQRAFGADGSPRVRDEREPASVFERSDDPWPPLPEPVEIEIDDVWAAAADSRRRVRLEREQAGAPWSG